MSEDPQGGRWRRLGALADRSARDHRPSAASEADTATVDWPAIHVAARLCDLARSGTTIGSSATSDVFGGAYCGGTYQFRGLAGLVALADAAASLATQAWEVVHTGSRDLASAAVVLSTDSGKWCCTLPDGTVRRARSRHGARQMATRYGGTASRIADGSDAAKRRAHVVTRLRSAVEIAIRVDALRRLLGATGVIDYRPAEQIAGVYGARVRLTGIRWLRGEAQESDTPPTVAEARAVVAGL